MAKSSSNGCKDIVVLGKKQSGLIFFLFYAMFRAFISGDNLKLLMIDFNRLKLKFL